MMTFEEFCRKVYHIANYLHTTVRVFESDGDYKALVGECDAFDRLCVTGRVSTRTITWNCGAGHTRCFTI